MLRLATAFKKEPTSATLLPMPNTQTMELSGWGRYPRAFNSVFEPATIDQAMPPADARMIVRGQGRSYGDAAMSQDGLVMLSQRLDRFISFDETTGLLTAEAGTTLAEVLREFVPRGWFPSVVPGTKFVSLGGSVAVDIHGKNHHRDGSIGSHVPRFKIILADGSSQVCTPNTEEGLFWATVGGMGLTGIITEVTLELIPIQSSFMIVQHHQARDLDASLRMFEDRTYDEHYTVAWIDCLAKGRSLGRGIFMRGHHATASELPQAFRIKDDSLRVPRQSYNLKFLPSWVLNPFSVALFNETYYRRQGRRKKPFIQHYDHFFFPLDRIENWNRLHGKRGFLQYQCVLPGSEAPRSLQFVFEELVRSRRPCFLSVLKRFGPANGGPLSFPLEGYTLSLDLPINDPDLFAFLDRLDEIVLSCGGRVYLAKDARLRAETFRAMYKRLSDWQRVKSRVDPGNRFDSDLARRLGLRSIPSP
jgi:decaprenylphospho-beta-D-ribofuranose 2-oxidase